MMRIKMLNRPPTGIPDAQFACAPQVDPNGMPQVFGLLSALDKIQIPTGVLNVRLSVDAARQMAAQLTNAADQAEALAAKGAT